MYQFYNFYGNICLFTGMNNNKMESVSDHGSPFFNVWYLFIFCQHYVVYSITSTLLDIKCYVQDFLMFYYWMFYCICKSSVLGWYHPHNYTTLSTSFILVSPTNLINKYQDGITYTYCLISNSWVGITLLVIIILPYKWVWGGYHLLIIQSYKHVLGWYHPTSHKHTAL